MAGKKDNYRPTDRKKWENAEYWKRLEAKRASNNATKKEK